jgi:hypothetical protein
MNGMKEELLEIFKKREDLMRQAIIISLTEKEPARERELKKIFWLATEKKDWPAVIEAAKNLNRIEEDEKKKLKEILEKTINKNEWPIVTEILKILPTENGEIEKIGNIFREKGFPEYSLTIVSLMEDPEKREKLATEYLRDLQEKIEKWLKVADEQTIFKSSLIEEVKNLAKLLPEPRKTEMLEKIFNRLLKEEKTNKAYLLAKETSNPQKFLKKVWKKMIRQGEITESLKVLEEIERELTPKEKEWFFNSVKKNLSLALEATKVFPPLLRLQKIREIFKEALTSIERKKRLEEEILEIAVNSAKTLPLPEKDERLESLIIVLLKKKYDREAKNVLQELEERRRVFWERILS